MTRVGSLFTGYGGLDLAVGGDLAWYSEIEPAACQVLEHHFPGVPNLGDITKIDWTQVEPVDVITGGYPCQPFSHAGNRKGKKDDRHLWPYVREAIRTIRPDYAILENVRGHLTLGLTEVLGEIASIGFNAEWSTFRASEIGAPHRRERIFIVASNPDGAGWSERGRSIAVPKKHSSAERAGDVATDTDGDGYGQQLLPAGMVGLESEAASEAQKRERTREVIDTGSVSNPFGEYTDAIVRWEQLTRPAPDATVLVNDKRRLNPVFVEWMMGLPEGWVTGHGLSAAKTLKMLGNGVCPQQARAAINGLILRSAP